MPILFDIELTGRPVQNAHFIWFADEFGVSYRLWSPLKNKLQPTVIVNSKGENHRDTEGERRLACVILKPVRYRIIAPENYEKSGGYYEYRVQVTQGDQIESAADIARQHSATIAFDRHKKAMYFVLRIPKRSIYEFDGLVAHLRFAQYPIVEKSAHYIVIDSNPRYVKNK